MKVWKIVIVEWVIARLRYHSQDLVFQIFCRDGIFFVHDKFLMMGMKACTAYLDMLILREQNFAYIKNSSTLLKFFTC